MNIIGKSGFSSSKPQLTYSVLYTVNTLQDNPNTETLSFKRRMTNTPHASPCVRSSPASISPTNSRSTNRLPSRPVRPASKHYYDMDYNTTTWNHNKMLVQSYVKNNTIQLYDKKLLSLAAELEAVEERHAARQGPAFLGGLLYHAESLYDQFQHGRHR